SRRFPGPLPPRFRRRPYKRGGFRGVGSPAPAGSREGGEVPSAAARQHAVRYSRTLRPRWRHVATTLRILLTKRLPVSLAVPWLTLRHSTAWRSARSAALVVGSMPSTRAKLPKAGPA